jgi:hypothetical protein
MMGFYISGTDSSGSATSYISVQILETEMTSHKTLYIISHIKHVQ